ncbi:response regulator [Nocardia salmonicida]|uniref:response regulator n=1 Tax=Nocardia salmonicida TaxID=53431 RepID=UPI003653ADE6
MPSGIRILIASPMGRVIAPTLSARVPDSTVAVATDPQSVVEAIVDTVRFDVVVTDLLWTNAQFGGLDVIDSLTRLGRMAPVLLAVQGHSGERDHLAEALLRHEVAGVYDKTAGIEPLVTAVHDVARGVRSQSGSPYTAERALYELFQGKRGTTAGRMAGAIAAGRATDAASLAEAVGVQLNTANKVANYYLGPIIRERAEYDPRLPMTLSAVYRWCGLHANYLVSWCRRNGHGDVLQATVPLSVKTPS